MERVTETWVTAPARPVSMTNRNACLVHIYPTGPGMGTRYTLSDTPLVIGRGSDCDIRINDHSVSRRHARIEAGPGDYVYVPPFVAHREENPSRDEEAVVVLARTTQEEIVVNLPGL